MRNWIQSVIDYVTNYREVNQYIIISTFSNPTFWIALGALALLGYLRVNARLLRHLKRQARRQAVGLQKKDLYNESVEHSSFICSKHHRYNTHYGVINKVGMDTAGNSQRAWHIYPMHAKDNTVSIDGSDHNTTNGLLVCKLACIKHIESKGYTIQYINERCY